MKIEKSTKRIKGEIDKETRRALRSMLYDKFSKARKKEVYSLQKLYNQLSNDINKNIQHAKRGS